ncbi:MAG: SurA N-terminal domain-containing protein [Gammaproteobacteria bacterium]|nr:SurA N-terminal domain-containing protein [Gammaproteobacteria bacterium]
MMLERIQQKMEGPAMKVVLAIIIIFFVFAGYFGANIIAPGNEQVANVDGVSITAAEIDNVINNQRRSNPNFDQQYPTEASKALLREQVRNQLINDRVYSNSIDNAGLTASKEQVVKQIHSMPEFQLGGEYDPATAKTIMAQNGISDARLYAIAKNQIVRDQFNKGISETSFVTDKEIEAFYRIQEQTRDGRVLTVPKAKFADGVSVSDEEKQAYYDENKLSYEQPEQVNLQYILVSKDSLADAIKVTITDEEVAEFYNDDANKAEFVSPDNIQVAHILIANDQSDAQAKATELLAQLEQGADFAELAKEHSSDTFSAAEGGALPETQAEEGNSGWVPEFEAAALELTEVGQVSDLVETDFGFHIIKLLERKAGESRDLAEVSEEIKQRIAEVKAGTEFFNKKALLDDALFSTESIEDLAKTAELPLQESGLFAANVAPADLSHPALIEQAFSERNIQSKEISDEINMGEQSLAYIVVKDHQAAGIKPMAEVEAQIVSALTQEKITSKTKEFAESIKTALEAGESVDTLLADKELTWIESNNFGSRDASLNPELASVLFKQVAPTDKPIIAVENLFSGDVAVMELRKVNYPDASLLDAAKKQQLKSLLANINSRNDFNSLVGELREKSEIQ